MKHRGQSWTRVVALVTALGACGGGDDAPQGKTGKEAYDEAIALLKEPVALISAYRPYVLEQPGKEKYAIRNRSDLDESRLYAANEIRHAANWASQKAELSPTKVLQDLRKPLTDVAIACADNKDEEKLKKCDDAVKAFDDYLAKLGDEAKGAGSGEVPRVGDKAITDKAKKQVEVFVKAKGPDANEKKFHAMLDDAKAKPSDVIALCGQVENAGQAMMDALKKAEQPLQRVAIKHKLLVQGFCVKLNRANGYLEGIGICKEAKETKKKDFDDTECVRICAETKTLLADRVPAACFEALQPAYDDYCVELEEEQKKKKK